jgi:multicomponent Na+:H+ antiporter subunit D
VGSTMGLVAFGVALTVFAGPLFRVADQSAVEMLDRTSYIQAVLGEHAPVPPIAQREPAQRELKEPDLQEPVLQEGQK